MKNLLLPALLLTLCACQTATTTEAPIVVEPPPPGPWLPLICDETETFTFTYTEEVSVNTRRVIRVTRVQHVAVVDIEPSDLEVRAFVSDDPCAGHDDCTVTSTDSVSPEGHWRLYGGSSDLVSGLDGGGSRVVCDVTDRSVITVSTTGYPDTDITPEPEITRLLRDAEYRTR